MLYWIAFLALALVFTSFSLNNNLDKNIRKVFKILLILLLIYFSGFRDGLGQDYLGYEMDIKYGYNSVISLYEPMYSILVLLINHTFLSSKFFFLFMAIITNVLFVTSFYRYKQKNTFLIMFIYLFGVIFYASSFNLVRQMCAASIFVYGIKYIKDRNFIKYLLFVLIAASIHASAIFLIPVYFIANKIYSNSILIFLLVLSIYLGQTVVINDVSSLSRFLLSYDRYVTVESPDTSSGYLTLFFNICLFLLIIRKEKLITNCNLNIEFNLFFIGVILYNLMPSLYMIFRFAIYFIMFAPIVLPYLHVVFPKQLAYTFLVLFFSVLFSYYMYRNIDNPRVIPSKILPITSIFDK